MNRERYIELDNNGNRLTEEEYNQGWHWCGEWDAMLVGPGSLEALFCSCNHPKIEEWKKTEEAVKMQEDINKRMDNKYLDKIAELDEEIGF